MNKSKGIKVRTNVKSGGLGSTNHNREMLQRRHP